jgi:hypothetical protein
LILDPEKIGKKISTVLFEKMLGRGSDLFPIKEEDELIL